jgi:hypothetical protein
MGRGNSAGFHTFGLALRRRAADAGGAPMMPRDARQEHHAKRSGSQNRARGRKIPVSCDDSEFEIIDERSRAVGLSRASYLRACGTGAPGPRAQRRPPVDAEALGRATAALNRVGNNVNQIAHVLNAGGTSVTTRECFAALAEVRAAAAAIRETVGRRDRP